MLNEDIVFTIKWIVYTFIYYKIILIITFFCINLHILTNIINL